MEETLEQGSEAWLKMRRMHITSSDAAIIMEINPWKTPYKLWCEKQGLIPPDKPNQKMEDGLRLEPFAREWFIKQTGIKVEAQVKYNDFLMASLDGYSKEENCITEFKCSEKTFMDARDGIIPEYYKCQVQHQLLTTGCPIAFYVCFWKDSGVIIHVKRDEEFIEEYYPKAKEFYQRMINYDPPAFTDRDYIPMENNEWKQAAIRYRECTEEIKKMEETQKNYKNQLISLSNGKICKGSGLKLCKIVKKGCIDYANVPQIKEMDLEKHRKPSTEYWSVYLEK